MTKCWSGQEVHCDCDSTNVEYIKDMDHDDGTCEIFRCNACGKRIHIELPD